MLKEIVLVDTKEMITTTSDIESSQSVVAAQTDVTNTSMTKPVLQSSSQQPVAPQSSIPQPAIQQPVAPSPGTQGNVPNVSDKLKPLTSVESKPSHSDGVSSNQQSIQDNSNHITRINGMDYQVYSTVQNNEKTYKFNRVSGKRGLSYDPNDSGVLKMISYMSTAFEMKIDLTKPYEQLVPVIIRVLTKAINE